MFKSTRKLNFLVIVLCAIMILSGCSSREEIPVEVPTASPEAEVSQITTEITMLLKTDDFVMEDWAVVQALFEGCQINAVIKTIRPERYIETLNVNLSSGVIYDVMELPPAYAQAADEYIIDAAPIINQFAPNYINWLNSFPADFVTALATPTGEIKVFPLREDVGVISAVPFINAQVEGRQFDSASFYSAIEASGGKFAVPGSTMTLCELMAPFFNTSTGVIEKNGTLVFGPLTDEFKAMLLYLNSLLSKNLLSESFFVYTPTNFLYDVKSGKVTAGIFTEKYYEQAYAAGMEPFMFSPVAESALPGQYRQPTSYAALTDASGKQEYAMKFIDYCFSDEGRRLLNNGVESLHYSQEENGVLSALAPYTRVNSYQWEQQGLTPEGLPGVYYNYWTRFDPTLYSLLVPMRQFAPSADMQIAPLPATGTNALASQVISGTINPVLNEWWSEFIIGTKSLSSDWNNYVKEVTYAGLDAYMDLHYR